VSQAPSAPPSVPDADARRLPSAPTLTLPPYVSGKGWEAIAAVALAAALAAVSVPARHRPRSATAIACGYFVVVALMRDARGGAESGYAALTLLPVLWAALYGTGRQLALMVGLTVATMVVPILAVGTPEYPVTEWRRAVVLGSVAAFTGVIAQRLVREISARSSVERHVAEIARQTSPSEARLAVIRAARAVTGADAVVLLEPDAEGLRATVAVGVPDGAELAVRDERSGALLAFASGASRFVSDAPGDADVSARLVAVLGARSLMFEPVCRGGRTLAVLVLVWRSRRRALPDPVRDATRLLAAEAGAAIERLALEQHLDELARTDALTGLPNRRSWDEELDRALARAERDRSPMAIALLDLDHFKRVNDEHGHQAGDRVLKESASAWRAALRRGDFLARVGGEEFGVILDGCGLADATELAERIRRATPGALSSSAGVAEWAPGEAPEALFARADAALYAAKDGGRDRTVAARSDPRGSFGP
jgi:diguanylate cyclase (GGDEF)-like protein